ncbi:HPr family phosphocarrier protein [Thermoflavimicrobium dichotomicum]|uniref:Phosphotransferase system HPr (HPr) family n=1 Tax=Thermoflavimicrobium dichotomicum TaxID=46223 RepID=A0A1I3PVX9_9BACL|nr:HPr family phosphocarrier protein [Thermoflavimicrobium dichotomicum]SFJ25492.1 phosphotransferase system HPr (HPr) family [Thermoflavimicrobium dichotomicum]
MVERTAQCQIASSINLAMVIQFVKKANQFNSYILIETDKSTVNAKSLLAMCLLVPSFINCTVTLRALGTDAEIALAYLKDMLSDRFKPCTNSREKISS